MQGLQAHLAAWLILLPSCSCLAFNTATKAPSTVALYSNEALEGLEFSKFPEPAQQLAATDGGPPRWLYRATQTLFGLVQASPLYPALKRKAIQKMKAASEAAGAEWDQTVSELAGECDDAALALFVKDSGVTTPEYYVRPFHAYDEGNMNWEAACEQTVASAGVGAAQFPGLPAPDGEERFRGAFDRELLDLLPADALARQPGAALVDLGCGTGTSARRLLSIFPQAASCIGFDLSPHMALIGKALQRRAADAADERLEIRYGDAARTGLADSSVDLVSLCLIMHELPAAASHDILAEACRVLKPGGHLAIFEMDPLSPGYSKIRASPLLFAIVRSTEPYLDEYFFDVAPVLDEYLAAAGLQMTGKRLIESNKHQVVLATKLSS